MNASILILIFQIMILKNQNNIHNNFTIITAKLYLQM